MQSATDSLIHYSSNDTSDSALSYQFQETFCSWAQLSSQKRLVGAEHGYFTTIG